jgi:hypothetical protein
MPARSRGRGAASARSRSRDGRSRGEPIGRRQLGQARAESCGASAHEGAGAVAEAILGLEREAVEPRGIAPIAVERRRHRPRLALLGARGLDIRQPWWHARPVFLPWYEFFPLLIVPPLLVVVWLSRLDGRERNAHWARFCRQMAAAGLPVREGGKTSDWGAEGQWNGLPVVAEIIKVGQGKSAVSRLLVRLLAPVERADLAVYAGGAVPAAELGTMRQLPTVPFGARALRIYAAEPAQAQAALSPRVMIELDELGVKELRLKERALALELDGDVSEASTVACAVELLTALAQGRPLRSAAAGGPSPTGWGTRWSLVAFAPLLAGLFGGLVLPILPPTQTLLSPLACERGELRMVWTSSGSGRSSGNMYCIDGQERESAFLRPYTTAAAGIFWLLTLALMLRARGRAPESEPSGPPALPRP